MKKKYKDNTKKNKFFAHLVTILLVVLFFVSLCFFTYHIYSINNKEVPTIKKLFDCWKIQDYQNVYDISGQILDTDSFNNRVLMFRGYSAFFLALSQTDISVVQNFLDESINSLRVAMINCPKKFLSQIYYMLGKTYFHKNVVSDYHYYSDLSVKYLQLAQSLGYKSSDIPEYLGLSYAELGLAEESIKSFTEALLVRESDELLLAIAQQYYNCQKANTAKQYLNKINQESSNELLVLKSRILLAQILIDEQKYDEALQEYESILKKDANSSDAYYGKGLVYEKQGDLVKARSEWRKALKIQVNHPGALNKMGKQ